MNPYIIIAAGIALGGAYFYGRHDGAEIAEAAALREERVAQIATDAAARSAAAAIANITVVNKTITGRIEKEIHEKPVYRDCRHDAIGLRLVNAALTGRADAADDRQLPAADAAR